MPLALAELQFHLLCKPPSALLQLSPIILSCYLFWSEPLPIHLTSLLVLSPIPTAEHGTKGKIIWLIYLCLTQSIPYPFPALQLCPTSPPLQSQTTSWAINQPLMLRAVIKGYFISPTKGNQYPQHRVYICMLLRNTSTAGGEEIRM